MKAVIQRVRKAAVSVEGLEVSRIGHGLLIFLGVAAGDRSEDITYLARKIPQMRVFDDARGKMNLTLNEVGGEILVISQFTLLADCRQGRRPGFAAAAPPEEGEGWYREFISEISRSSGAVVQAGMFGARMLVSLENDGPATFVLDSRG